MLRSTVFCTFNTISTDESLLILAVNGTITDNCREAEKLPSDLCELSASDLLPAYANSSQGLSQIMDDANVSMKSDKAELCSYLPGNSRFHQVDYEHQPLTTNADVNQLTDNISAMSMEEIDHFGAYVRINHDEGTATDSCDVGSTADVPCPTLNSIAGLANHLTSDLQELQLAYTHHQLQNGA